MSEVAAGSIVDAQGVAFDLAETDLIAGVVVIAEVVAEDGSVSVSVGSTDGMSWLAQRALIEAARDISRSGGWSQVGEDE